MSAPRGLADRQRFPQGVRVGGPEIASEADHFYVCATCKQAVGMRDLGQVFHHEEPDHQPIPNDDAGVPEPIPERVYWAPLADNFYSAEGQGMGLEFYRKWKPRRAEFPQGETAGWGPGSAHNPFKDQPRTRGVLGTGGNDGR